MKNHDLLAIKVDNVSKLFRRQKQGTLKEMLPALFGGQQIVDSFWALKDVSFTVKKGEALGIIGPNGSGKSTLLKLIAGVSRPTRGEIEVFGRIAPLIELGAGFHPELTGRENVFLNGIILGMTRDQVEHRFQDIVDFAELWEFIDQPIKHYSSGMYLRLAFAVAIHTNPRILLIDEILAVGDASFQAKCRAKMESLKAAGVTIILITHDTESVKSFCDRALFLQYGKIVSTGSPQAVVTKYLDSI